MKTMKQQIIHREPVDDFSRETALMGVKETLLN